MGHHSEEDIIEIAKQDLKALSDFLGILKISKSEFTCNLNNVIILNTGDKQYLLGNEITEYDCAIFGQLAQVYYQSPDGVMEDYTKTNLRNLCEYCDKIKERIWPDWKECISSKEEV